MPSCTAGLDSSPQGKNFLLVEEFLTNPEPAISAFLQLEPDEWPPEVRKMTQRRPKPILTLGKNCGAFTHKLDALFYALNLETPDLESYCRSVVSITTDQGVEYSVASAPSFSQAELVRDWGALLKTEVQSVSDGPPLLEDDWSSMYHDAAQAVAVEVEEYGDESEEWQWQLDILQQGLVAHAADQNDPTAQVVDVQDLLPGSQFRNALRIPGLKHISDNLLKSCLQQKNCYDNFIIDLKSIELLLRRVPCRERLAYACIPASDSAAQTQMKSWSYSLRGLRWEQIRDFTLNVT